MMPASRDGGNRPGWAMAAGHGVHLDVRLRARSARIQLDGCRTSCEISLGSQVLKIGCSAGDCGAASCYWTDARYVPLVAAAQSKVEAW
jgi:hypothetical protein